MSIARQTTRAARINHAAMQRSFEVHVRTSRLPYRIAYKMLALLAFLVLTVIVLAFVRMSCDQAALIVP